MKAIETYYHIKCWLFLRDPSVAQMQKHFHSSLVPFMQYASDGKVVAAEVRPDTSFVISFDFNS
jgi:hypothetical protein